MNTPYVTRPGIVILLGCAGLLYETTKYVLGFETHWWNIFICMYWATVALAVHWKWGKQ